MKQLLAALLACLLCLACVSALAADNGASPLTADEITRWAEGYLDLARQSKTLNDPTDLDAATEAGFAFVYPFATLYMSQPTLDSSLRGVEIVSATERGPHVTRVAMTTAEVLGSFYNENDQLLGSYGEAVLYLLTGENAADGALIGLVTRNGQRLETIQYSAMIPVDAERTAYTDTGVIYTIEGDVVTAITAYGLDATISRIAMQETLRLMGSAAAEDSYAAVPVSYNGLELTAFGPEDLTFAGITFPEMSPEEAMALFGPWQDAWANAEDGYDRTLTFGPTELCWRYDSRMENPRLISVTLTDASTEGPRAVRVGDSLNSVMCRFRYGEGEYDGTTEELYGYPGEVPYGIAEYSEDNSAILRYVCALPDGREAVLLLPFSGGELTEVQVYIAEE